MKRGKCSFCFCFGSVFLFHGAEIHTLPSAENAVSLFSRRGRLRAFESVHIREGGRDPRVGM